MAPRTMAQAIPIPMAFGPKFPLSSQERISAVAGFWENIRPAMA
jgi:hypothetical protein